jgi:hypothetical protein
VNLIVQPDNNSDCEDNAKWSAYQIPSVIDLFVVLVSKA